MPSGRPTPPIPDRGPTSSTTSSGRASPPGSATPRDLPLDSHLHTVRSPDASAMLEAYCVLALERGIAELAITDHVDFDPTMPAYGFASFVDRERDVREAAERWADRGLAIRFGVEVTYERAYEEDIRGWLRAAPPRLRHRQRPRQRGVAVQGVAASPSFVAGRPLADVVAPYFDEVIGAARSGPVRHDRPPGLREALPRAARHAGAARRGPGAVRAGARGAHRHRAPPWRSTRPASASCRARRTRPRRSSRATASWAADT